MYGKCEGSISKSSVPAGLGAGTSADMNYL